MHGRNRGGEGATGRGASDGGAIDGGAIDVWLTSGREAASAARARALSGRSIWNSELRSGSATGDPREGPAPPSGRR